MPNKDNMKKESSLISNTFILALGRFLPQLTALITLPIYTGMLTTSEYGSYDLINTVVYILDIVVLIQIHQAVFRYLIDVRESKKEQEKYITTTFAFELVPAVLTAVIFGFCYRSFAFPIPILLGYYMFINLQYSVIGQISRGLGKNKAYAISSMIQAVLNMALVVLLMSGIKLGFLGLFISLDTAYTVACLFQIIVCKQLSFVKSSGFNFIALKEMLKYSWPMVPNTLSIWLVNTCDKFIIRIFMGVSYNGIFAVAQKIPTIFTSAYSVFNMAWQESASLSLKDDDHDSYYEKIFTALYDFLVGCMLILISATPILFLILVQGDYSESYPQIPLLYIGVFFSSISSFYGSIYVAQKRTREVGISSMLAAVVNCIINLTLIHSIGLYAASISTIVSYVILSSYRFIDIKKKELAIINYKWKRILFGLLLIAVSCVLCYQQNMVCNIINVAMGVTFFLILNWKMVKAVLMLMSAKLKRK